MEAARKGRMSPPQGELEKITPLFEVPTEHDIYDITWLEAVDVPTDNIDPQAIETLVQRGSQLLKSPSQCKTITDDVLEARQTFFDLIGYPEGSSVRCAIEKTNPLLVPPDSVVESIRTQQSLGLDVKRVINIYPRSLYMSQGDLYGKVGTLQSLGVNAVKALSRQPKLLSMAEKNIEEKVELYKSLGLDGANMINKQPTSIAYSKENITGSVNYIKRILRLWGKSEEEATEFVENNPQILGNSKNNLKTRARIISSTTGSSIRLSTTNAINVPVESLLFALSQTKDVGELFYKARRHQTDRKTTIERREDVSQILNDPELVAQIGDKVVRAYEIYLRDSRKIST